MVVISNSPVGTLEADEMCATYTVAAHIAFDTVLFARRGDTVRHAELDDWHTILINDVPHRRLGRTRHPEIGEAAKKIAAALHAWAQEAQVAAETTEQPRLH